MIDFGWVAVAFLWGVIAGAVLTAGAYEVRRRYTGCPMPDGPCNPKRTLE